jgi:glycosyltransferase involved in cell wall biosynthesis
MLNMGYISPSKFIVNYNGVDKRRFNSIRKWSDNLSKELRLLSIGSLSSAKGQDVAIRALQVIKENNINCYLDICGSGENLEKLKVLAQGIGVDDRVIFHGDVSNVIKYYEESAIVIIPSIFESFGYVAVESALMNRPVVASNTGGLSEIIIDGETGILVTPGDHHDLANSVIKMISNIEGTNCMVSAARARAIDLFDTERMLNVLYEIYDSTTPDSV